MNTYFSIVMLQVAGKISLQLISFQKLLNLKNKIFIRIQRNHFQNHEMHGTKKKKNGLMRELQQMQALKLNQAD